MITKFNELREYIDPEPNKKDHTIRDSLKAKDHYLMRLEYAKTMALIQISQDLNDIKVALIEGKINE